MWQLTMILALTQATTRAEAPLGLASEVKEIFRAQCFECHGGSKTSGAVRILDRENLVNKARVVVPGNGAASELLKRVASRGDEVMPPLGQRRLREVEIARIREWIDAGAPAFPSDAGKNVEQTPLKLDSEYVLGAILAHIRSLAAEERRFVRYFSLAHLAGLGTTEEHLAVQRRALTKAINHLSRQPEIVLPTPIDPQRVVLAVDLRQLGWHVTPMRVLSDGGQASSAELDLFDLALLEYPYGVFDESRPLGTDLDREYFVPAGLVRPIAAVRADWFVCAATQSPLYEDFLSLPRNLVELESDLGVDAGANLRGGSARRAGFAVSDVSRNGRVVERHPIKSGYYWKSFDFSSNVGPQNFFRDPLRLRPFGGEMIFSLPNGMQGYFIVDSSGERLPFAPTQVVVDSFADDATVRLGLSCIRCHDQGIKRFADDVREAALRLPASAGISRDEVLRLFPPAKELDVLVDQDRDRFAKAHERLLENAEEREPISVVARRFLQTPLGLSAATGELGLANRQGLEEVFRTRTFVGLGLIPLAGGRVIRRDQWEDLHGRVVRELGLGAPVSPVDALTRPDVSLAANLQISLTTNHENNTFAAGDDLVIQVENLSSGPVHVELVGTGARGEQSLLTPRPVQLAPKATFRFPERGAIRVQPRRGKETVTVFAAEQEFPAGKVVRGERMSDRVVHARRRDSAGSAAQVEQLSQLVKKSITIETR